MPVIATKKVTETKLWREIQRRGDGESDAKALAANLPGLCEEASQRMKECLALHGQYTLHDEVHLLRVTELAGRLNGHSETWTRARAGRYVSGRLLTRPVSCASRTLKRSGSPIASWAQTNP